MELGVDALNPVQVSNDPLKVKQQYGDRLTVCGGFDNVNVLDNPSATVQQMKDSINETLYTLAPGGKYNAFCYILDKFPERYGIFLECLDEYNRPLMEWAGVEFVPHVSTGENVYNLAEKAQ